MKVHSNIFFIEKKSNFASSQIKINYRNNKAKMKIKFFSLFIFHLLLSCTALCQEEELVDPKSYSYIKSYLGKINNKDIYLVQNNFHNDCQILTCQDDKKISSQDCLGLTNLRFNGLYKKKRTADYDIQYKEWFIYKNELYAVTQKTFVNKVYIALKKFNSDLSTLDSTLLYVDSIKNYNNFIFDFKLTANQICLFGNTSNELNQFFTIIFNLDNKKLNSQKLDLNLNQKFSCSDFIFNSKQELMAVFEGEENLNNGYRVGFDKIVPTNLKSMLVFMSGNKVSIKHLKSNYDNEFLRSYKFHSLNEENVLLGALTFSSTKGMSMNGYHLTTWNYNDSVPKTEGFFKTKNLNNQEFWLSPEYKKVVSDGYIKFYHFQFLKEIRQLEDGTLIFISEGVFYKNSQNTSTFNMPNTSTTSSSPTLYTNATPIYSNESATSIFGDIIVSKIDLNQNSLIWSAKNKNRFDDLSEQCHVNVKKNSYFLTIDKNQIILYYPESTKNFDEFGRLKEKYKYGLYYEDITIAKFEIYLSNGNVVLNRYKENLGENNIDVLNVEPSHINESNELVLISQKLSNQTSLFQYKIHIKQK